ncbi:putative transcription factor GRAS family [Helianthus debilis subsp. tardiflorus]
MVIVEDMLDFNKDLLELDPDEALGVYTSYGLWSMITQQDHLESLMKVIKSSNPHVMVVSEVAANLNSPTFVNRFIEGLFYYRALFDSIEDCVTAPGPGLTRSRSRGAGNLRYPIYAVAEVFYYRIFSP